MADGQMGGARAEQACPLAGRSMKCQAGASGRQRQDFYLARADPVAESCAQRLGSRLLGRETARKKGNGRLRRQGGKFAGREELFEKAVTEPGMGRPDARQLRHVDAKSDDHRRAPVIHPWFMDAGTGISARLAHGRKIAYVYALCQRIVASSLPSRQVRQGDPGTTCGKPDANKRAQRRESGKE